MRSPPIKHASKYGVIKLRFRKRSHALTYEQKGGYQSTADFSNVKQKPRWVEEHDSAFGIISVVEAGTGVTIGADVFGHSFGNRVKLWHITPEPKPISVGIVALKGRLSPAAEKFWQYAKEAASPAARPKALRTPR
jgi:DNA-binding transcriptional LysR family regulator